MSRNYSENIYEELSFMPITLISNKINVGIIGAGNASLIKTKSFHNKGANVSVLSLDFLDNFYEFKDLKLIKDKYNKEFLLDKHIIVIAIDDLEVIKTIIKDCDNLFKIYINCSKFREGLSMLSSFRESKNLIFSVNTKHGNPKSSIMICEHIENELKSFDDFIEFTSFIRNNLSCEVNLKKEVLSFINSLDFKYFYDRNKHYEVMSLFYDFDILDTIKKGKKVL